MEREFIITTDAIGENRSVKTDCNAIVFINTGSDIVTIDGTPIPVYAAGMQEYPRLVYQGLAGEKMTNQFSVSFASAVLPQVMILRKTYTK